MTDEVKKASEEYCPDDAYPFGPDIINKEVRKAFIAGYNLCKEQMLKDAVEGEICHDRAGVDYLDYDIARLDKYIFSRFKVGDKVRIIVIPNTDEK